MSAPSVLLIGTGFDGPADVAVLPSSVRHAFDLFGAYVSESFEIDQGQISLSLGAVPASNVTFFTWVDGVLTEFVDIASVSVSGNVVSFEKLGHDAFSDAGSDTIELIVRYLRSMDAEATQVYKGYAEAASAAGGQVHVMRVGGEHAGVTLGDESSLTLTSIYRGSLYNQATAIIENGELVLIQPPGKGEPLYYDLTGTVVDLVDAMNLDHAKGYSCITATCSGAGELVADEGTYRLAGGEDGELTEQLVRDTLDQIELSGIKVVSILGLRFPCNDIDLRPITSILTRDFFEDQGYPTMYVQGVDYSSECLPGAYVDDLSAAGTIADGSLTKVVGEGYYSYGILEPYWSSLAPAYAAALAHGDTGCLYASVNVPEIRPYLVGSLVAQAAAAGYASFARSLSRGIVVASDVASDPSWDSVCYHTYLSVVSTVNRVLSPLLGTTYANPQQIETDLTAAMRLLPGLARFSVDVQVDMRNAIEVGILAKPFGRLATISFGVVIDAQFAAL